MIPNKFIVTGRDAVVDYEAWTEHFGYMFSLNYVRLHAYL